MNLILFESISHQCIISLTKSREFAILEIHLWILTIKTLCKYIDAKRAQSIVKHEVSLTYHQHRKIQPALYD